MERIKIVALIMLLPMLLISCSHGEAALDYQELPFTARFAFSFNEICFSGTIRAAELADSPRDVSISFESPENLAGISVERKEGKVTTSLGDISTFSEDTRWLALADLFSIDGTVSSTKKIMLGGTSCILATVATNDGEKYSIYIDKNGFPLRICGNVFGKSFVLDILFFRQDV